MGNALINKFFENVSFIVFNFKCFPKGNIFFQKCLFLMMLFLVLDVSDNIRHRAFTIGESPETIRPGKFLDATISIIDPFSAFRFYNLDQLRHILIWPETNKHMQMVGHRINLKHFLCFILNYSRDVFMEFIFPGKMY